MKRTFDTEIQYCIFDYSRPRGGGGGRTIILHTHTPPVLACWVQQDIQDNVTHNYSIIKAQFLLSQKLFEAEILFQRWAPYRFPPF